MSNNRHLVFVVYFRGLYVSEKQGFPKQIAINQKKAYEWYVANFRNQILFAGRIVELTPTSKGMRVRIEYSDADKLSNTDLNSLEDLVADPDDDGNYPIGVSNGKRMLRYNRDFTKPSAASNVLVRGFVRGRR